MWNLRRDLEVARLSDERICRGKGFQLLSEDTKKLERQRKIWQRKEQQEADSPEYISRQYTDKPVDDLARAAVIVSRLVE